MKKNLAKQWNKLSRKWSSRYLPVLAPWFIRLVGLTLRVRIRDHCNAMQGAIPQPILIAFWHNRSLMMPYFNQRYIKKLKNPKVLVSLSRDGQMIADIIRHFGIGTVRGSSSKKAISAVKEIARQLENEHISMAITPDGPRGPIYRVQPGILYLAANTDLKILPVSYHLTWKWELKSWDRFQIPLPFSRCELVFGELMSVHEDDDLDSKADELAQRLGR